MKARLDDSARNGEDTRQNMDLTQEQDGKRPKTENNTVKGAFFASGFVTDIPRSEPYNRLSKSHIHVWPPFHTYLLWIYRDERRTYSTEVTLYARMGPQWYNTDANNRYMRPLHSGYGRTGFQYRLRCDAGQFPDHHWYVYKAVCNYQQPGTPLAFYTMSSRRQKSTNLTDLHKRLGYRQPFETINISSSDWGAYRNNSRGLSSCSTSHVSEHNSSHDACPHRTSYLTL